MTQLSQIFNDLQDLQQSMPPAQANSDLLNTLKVTWYHLNYNYLFMEVKTFGSQKQMWVPEIDYMLSLKFHNTKPTTDKNI